MVFSLASIAQIFSSRPLLRRKGGGIVQLLSSLFLTERDRWILWVPVCFGAGIAFYFSLSSEPPPWSGGVVLAGTALCGFASWRFPRIWLVPVATVGVAAAGFAMGQWRTASVAAPVLERSSGKLIVAGAIEEVELLAGGALRVTLREVELTPVSEPGENAMPWDRGKPEKVRIRLRPGAPDLSVGDRLETRAVLNPPSRPVLPGAYDFARQAWFQRLGAVGFAYGPVSVSKGSARGRDGLNALRHAIGTRIAAVLPGSVGGVASALITGETGGISQGVLEDYRNSGLAHILSISGLHMSLLAGLVFFFVRGGLALIPFVALRCPIKKWSALVAVLATFFYMMIAGAPVPAQRSFLMTGLVLLAVMLDRQALSPRLVACAAMVVLVLAPESLVGPSFQMSFAAVLALICGFEALSPRLAAWRGQDPGWGRRVFFYVIGLTLSSLIAGLATSAYGIYHFNRFAVWQVMANLAAVPVTGLVIMPFALMSALLMPFGLESWALVPMGWGVAVLNTWAAWVARWPGAVVTLPVMPSWGLASLTMGGLWLLLWRHWWRLGGLPLIAAGGLSLTMAAPLPDVVVDGRGYSWGVRMADGGLSINRGGRFVQENWERRAGPVSPGTWPKRGHSDDDRLSCDANGCRYRYLGYRVALVSNAAGLEDACAEADVVIGSVPLRVPCRHPRVVIDRFDLWRRGGHALWLSPQAIRVETVADAQGRRPWSFHPRRRSMRTGVEVEEDDGNGTDD